MSLFSWLLFFPLFQIETQTVHTFSSTVACQPAAWVNNPGIVKGKFLGDLEMTCVFTQANGGGIKAAAESLEDNIAKTSDIVHQGPISETFENLPSVFYEVTRKTKDSSGDLTIKSENHIATDQSTKLLSVTTSTSVKGTGNMSYLRKLNGRLEINSTGTDSFEMKITSHTEVSKPWFAPDDMFKKEVQKKGKDSFEKKTQALANDLAKVL